MVDSSRGTPATLEQAVVELPGVRAARVRGSPSGQVTEIHVVGDATKPAKQIVRDIQTLAFARLGMDIDYRTISVVQIDNDSGPSRRPNPSAGRPVLASVGWTVSAARAICTVQLTSGSREVKGSADGAASVRARMRLAAAATAQAIELLLTDVLLDVATVDLLETAGSRVSIVLLEKTSRQALLRESLVGSSLVASDEADATARAVLDAVNRRLGW